MLRTALSIAATIAAGCSTAACGGDDADRATARQAQAPVALSLRQAIGQRFVFPFAGTTPPKALERRIRRGEAAGVILFGRNVRSVGRVRAMTRRLQAIPRPPGLRAPLLVLADHEGGPVRRLPGGPDRAAAQTTTATQARAAGVTAGRLLRRGGVNVDLAPVVDVGRPGSAMRRERRAYPGDAPSVARLAGAFAGGLRAANVEAAFKHFPGFGAATVNTDDAPARITTPLATLRERDLKPYELERQALRMVMLSTAVYPARDPRPAAFSRRWVTDELRTRLRLPDVVAITDDLQTPAVARYGSPAQLAFFAVQAGVDLPLFAKDYRTAARAAEGLRRAVAEGALTRADLDAGARRVLALRAALKTR
ncbi:glycoside hydrolase family 3 protein [Conexibacter sp. SYSU D00693]|uniref:glycoside hydrolase family 3 protein n=1 Tax=Conexibacter sp. SYSU D00693 TaxID=2812560 RepID=UPI00196AD881|nr:glycoside hydrolase family 3 protein [Conexibacter sp. SYSU D00693]